MAGGKGGSTTSTVEVPQYIEDAARRNLERADLISKIGYVPYYGPEVAAMTPAQEAAFQQLQSPHHVLNRELRRGRIPDCRAIVTHAGDIQHEGHR